MGVLAERWRCSIFCWVVLWVHQQKENLWKANNCRFYILLRTFDVFVVVHKTCTLVIFGHHVIHIGLALTNIVYTLSLSMGHQWIVLRINGRHQPASRTMRRRSFLQQLDIDADMQTQVRVRLYWASVASLVLNWLHFDLISIHFGWKCILIGFLKQLSNIQKREKWLSHLTYWIKLNGFWLDLC